MFINKVIILNFEFFLNLKHHKQKINTFHCIKIIYFILTIIIIIIFQNHNLYLFETKTTQQQRLLLLLLLLLLVKCLKWIV